MEYYRNGIIYYVKKIENENYSQFKERINLIFSQNINSPDDFEQVEKLINDNTRAMCIPNLIGN